jgi:hypothetical protein
MVVDILGIDDLVGDIQADFFETSALIERSSP